MKKQLSTAQFVECVYRWFHGETLTEIADRFSVTPQALGNLKKRRKDEWDAIIAELTTGHLGKLASDNDPSQHLSEVEKRANTLLFRELANQTSQATMIQRLRNTFRCSVEEAEGYIDRFQQRVQVTLFD